jgi:hypothetical protein
MNQWFVCKPRNAAIDSFLDAFFVFRKNRFRVPPVDSSVPFVPSSKWLLAFSHAMLPPNGGREA